MTAPADQTAVGIIAGAGSLPFAVADALVRRARRAVIYGVRGFCDAARITSYPHHWVALGQAGRLMRLLRDEGCRDVVFIGGLVRPALSELRLDLGTLRILPRIARGLRGGDDHLLVTIGSIFEQNGFRLIGVTEAAPELAMPAGDLAQQSPDAGAQADIARGLAVLAAISPFDIGQAVVVIDGHVVAVEGIEGTDGLLARVAELRSQGRIRAPRGRGVLVKAPKLQQDRRFDLPTLGPRTIEGAAAAGLKGVALAAGQAIVAEPQQVVDAADRAGLFVSGVTP
jgi:DUF1009 family protein